MICPVNSKLKLHLEQNLNMAFRKNEKLIGKLANILIVIQKIIEEF